MLLSPLNDIFGDRSVLKEKRFFDTSAASINKPKYVLVTIVEQEISLYLELGYRTPIPLYIITLSLELIFTCQMFVHDILYITKRAHQA